MRRGNDRDGRGSGRGFVGARRTVVIGALLGVATLTTASRATVVVDHISDGSWKTTSTATIQYLDNTYPLPGQGFLRAIAATPVRVTGAGQTLRSISGIFGTESGRGYNDGGFSQMQMRLFIWNSIDEWKLDPFHTNPATGGLSLNVGLPTNPGFEDIIVGDTTFGMHGYKLELEVTNAHFTLNPDQTYVMAISPAWYANLIAGEPIMPFASGGIGVGPDLFYLISSGNPPFGPDTFPNLGGAPGDYAPYRVETTLAIPGDANGDDRVNFDDLVILAQHYNRDTGQLWSTGDFTGDRDVNFDDLIPLAQHYNIGANFGSLEGVSAGFAADWALAQSLVPEPTLLLGVAAFAPLTMRRRNA